MVYFSFSWMPFFSNPCIEKVFFTHKFMNLSFKKRRIYNIESLLAYKCEIPHLKKILTTAFQIMPESRSRILFLFYWRAFLTCIQLNLCGVQYRLLVTLLYKYFTWLDYRMGMAEFWNKFNYSYSLFHDDSQQMFKYLLERVLNGEL